MKAAVLSLFIIASSISGSVPWCIWYNIDMHRCIFRNRAPGCYEGIEIARVMGGKVELRTISGLPKP